MPLAIPAELKKITQYIRRAEELDRDKSRPESRLVAYYCRQYAVMTGISLPNSTAAAKTCLSTILNDLEVEKGPMSNFTKEEAEVISRGFAANVFDKADEIDRAGLADKSTARTFYASAVFYDVLQQFTKKDGDVEEEGTDAYEDQQKRVYAKWKATEILKAIKEGRAVTPGGYGETQEEESEEKESEDMGMTPPAPVSMPIVEDEEEEMVIPPPPLAPPSFNEAMANSETHNQHQGVEEEGGVEDESNVEVSLGPPPSYPGDGEINIITPSSPTHTSATSAPDGGPPALETSHSTIMARQPDPKPAKPAKNSSSWFGNSSSSSSSSKSKRISKEAMEDAIELTKFALAALETKDADMASNRLEQALQLLGRR